MASCDFANREVTVPRYLGNSNTREVHDSWNEQTDCLLAGIEIEHRTYFDSLEEAHQDRYTDCQWCIVTKPASREHS